MADDDDLATPIRDLIGPDPDPTEKKMSGGPAFPIRGHMAISASGQGGVLVHVDPGRSAGLAATTRAATAVMQGREMPGWLRVSPQDLASDDDLSRWADIGVGHARSLPPQQPAKNKPKKQATAPRGRPRAAGRCVTRNEPADGHGRHQQQRGRHGGTHPAGRAGRAGPGRRDRRPELPGAGGPGTGRQAR